MRWNSSSVKRSFPRWEEPNPLKTGLLKQAGGLDSHFSWTAKV